MYRRPVKRLAVAVLLLTGCQDVSGPADVWVVSYDATAHDLRLSPQRIDTIESVAEGRGGTTRLLKEPVLAVDADDNPIFKGGVAPAILFDEDAEGRIVPQDWDSLTLLSYYHHLEKSVAYFQSLGFDTAPMVPLPSYYRIQAGFDQTVIGLTDNAAYLPTGHAFLLFESFFIHDIPLAMNDGVVTHEFAHAIFHRVMNGDERMPIEYRLDWPAETINHLGGLHEGQSDIFAAMQFDEPDFFRFSFPGYEDRDMRVARVMTDEEYLALQAGEFEVHDFGAIIAAAAWEFSERIGSRARTAELTLAAENAMVADLDASFEVTDFFSRFADLCTPGEKVEACAVLCERFPQMHAGMPTCACP